jgi:uncharacterized Zn-binding protein involved in type VI secretion
MSGVPSTIGADVGAVFTDWWSGLSDAVNPPQPPPEQSSETTPGEPPPAGWVSDGDAAPASPPSPAQQAAHQTAQTVRSIATAVASVVGALGLVQQALDIGFAELTAPLAKLFPALPAATQTMPYLGVPHTHPRPPPIPLPGIGMILFGCHLRTLINGMPAARAGDLGLAPTCGGFLPFFEIQTGSSNVFIGGVRAARIGDFCLACSSTLTTALGPAEAIFELVASVAGVAVGALDVAADLEEEAEAEADDDAAMVAAKGLSATMTAVQMANDLVRMAIGQLMGKDPGSPNIGFVMMGQPNVLIGGFPMINMPDPVSMLLGKLHLRKAKPKGKHVPEEDNHRAGPKGRC